MKYTFIKVELTEDEEFAALSNDEVVSRKILELIGKMSEDGWEPIFPLVYGPTVWFKKND